VNAVAAVSRGPGRIDLFWIDADRALWHRGFREDAWAEPEYLGGSLASGPAVTAWGDEEMEVFAVMPAGDLQNRYWDGEAWHEWESLGGELDPAGSPSASSWGADRLDVFAPGRDGTIWHRWWDGTRWVDWERLAG
jgi:sialidase-1